MIEIKKLSKAEMIICLLFKLYNKSEIKKFAVILNMSTIFQSRIFWATNITVNNLL